MKHSSLIRIALTASAVLVTFGGAAACAATHDDAPTVAVSYQDLDISTPNGAQMLYRRIQSAALKVCGEVQARDFARSRAQRACYANAVASAVDTVNQPQLSAVHRIRTTRSPA